MATLLQKSGRSIPDQDLDMIDGTWGEDIPAVQKNVQRLWGVAVPGHQAMMLEKAIAQAVHRFTVESGKPLNADQARILIKLAPCLHGDPYDAGTEWVDIPTAAAIIDRSEGHVRRMLIDDKITVRIIRRPSSGKMAEKRWLFAEDLRG